MDMAKGQLILKANFLFLFEPKTQQNYFLISTLASKKRSDKKIKALYITNKRLFNIPIINYIKKFFHLKSF